MEQQTTGTWVERLLAEVKEFDGSMFSPTNQVERGEKVVGDCPEIAKPYFALAQYYLRECKRIKLEEEFTATAPEDLVRYKQMDQKNDALMELFWGLVYDALSVWSLNIGVRKDWKIVQTKPKDPREVIAGILGIGI